MNETALQHFRRLLDEQDEPLRLAEAVLHIAADRYPELAVEEHLDQLRQFGQALRRRIPADAAANYRVQALNHFLFDELGFHGNSAEYYDPRNSYLNEVLARRTGIPITLAIVYICVGRSAGLNLQGVAFPGHFLVRLKVGGGLLVLDPYQRGLSHSEDSLRALLGGAPTVPLGPLLEACDARQIALRVLRNLVAIHDEADRVVEALDVLSRMLVLEGHNAASWRRRADLHARAECFCAAAADLEQALRIEPQHAAADAWRGILVDWRQRCARLN